MPPPAGGSAVRAYRAPGAYAAGLFDRALRALRYNDLRTCAGTYVLHGGVFGNYCLRRPDPLTEVEGAITPLLDYLSV